MFRVLVSATGECTPVNDDGDLIPGDDVDESVGVREVTRQRQTRKLSLPHMSFGKLTGSFEDKIIDAFMWLRKQTQGKQIHATKVQQKASWKSAINCLQSSDHYNSSIPKPLDPKWIVSQSSHLIMITYQLI